MKKIILSFCLFFLFFAFSAYAQGPGFPPIGEDINDAPIDGGATLIGLAAAGYAYKKLKNKSRQVPSDN